jgi:hypothetical protein
MCSLSLYTLRDYTLYLGVYVLNKSLHLQPFKPKKKKKLIIYKFVIIFILMTKEPLKY